jgi:hypothetical protein
MQGQKQRGGTGVMDRAATGGSSSPVDDRTYNLMQALVSKLEAIEAYEMYAEDDGGQIFNDLLVEERQHAERLLGELRSAFGAS